MHIPTVGIFKEQECLLFVVDRKRYDKFLFVLGEIED